MTSLPGGPADKAGNRYETLWGAGALLEIIEGKARDIRIEVPGEDSSEFRLTRTDRIERWQTKRISSTANWTILSCQSWICDALNESDQRIHHVFASMSQFPELRDLANHARNAASYEEFKAEFLRNGRDDDFNSCVRLTKITDERLLFERLKRIYCRHADDDGLLLENVLLRCAAQFGATGNSAMDALRALYIDSVHKTLTVQDIETALQKRGIFRTLAVHEQSLVDQFKEATKAFVAGLRASLILGNILEPTDVARIVNELDGSEGKDILFTGPAGGGKSIRLLQITESFEASGIPTLAIRLDTSCTPSGFKIPGLEMPNIGATQLAGYIGTLAARGPIAVVIDQLDAVSRISARHPGCFEIAANLIASLRSLRESGYPIHVIAACRLFDWRNDRQLSALFPKPHHIEDVELLEPTAVESVLKLVKAPLSRVTAPQKELLRTPLHLFLFVEAYKAGESLEAFNTATSLFSHYWNAKQRAFAQGDTNRAQTWSEVIEKFANELQKRESLSAHRDVLDAFGPDIVDKLVSDGVLHQDRNALRFFHESFSDYCIARNFSRSVADIVEWVLTSSQSLFTRSTVRQILQYTRESDEPRYAQFLTRLTECARVRPHLKLLAVSLLGSFAVPLRSEIEFIGRTLERVLSRRRAGIEVNAIDRWMLFAVSNSEAIIDALAREGWFRTWLVDPTESELGQISWLLWCHREARADLAAELLGGCANSSARKRRVAWAFRDASCGRSRKWFDVHIALLKDGALDTSHANRSGEEQYPELDLPADLPDEWLLELFTAWLGRIASVMRVLPNSDDPPGLHEFERQEVQQIYRVAESKSLPFLQALLPLVLEIAEVSVSHGSEMPWKPDHVWRRSGNRPHYLSEHLMLAIAKAIEKVAATDSNSLRPLFELLWRLPLDTANAIYLTIGAACPHEFGREAIERVIDEPLRLFCGTSWNSVATGQRLLSRCSHMIADDLRSRLETVIAATYSEQGDGPAHRLAGYGLDGRLLASISSSRLSADSGKRDEVETPIADEDDEVDADVGEFLIKSPVPEETASEFTDDRWIDAIETFSHSDDNPQQDWRIGGARELSPVLEKMAATDPKRFTNLMTMFPRNANPLYFAAVLSGLRQANASSLLRVRAIESISGLNDAWLVSCGLRLLESWPGDEVPPQVVLWLEEECARSLDPPKDSGPRVARGDELLTEGINTVRGMTVWTIGQLIHTRPDLARQLDSAIVSLSADASMAVRTCAAKMLRSLARHEPKRAISLFAALIDSEDRLLQEPPVISFLIWQVDEGEGDYRSIVLRMLTSPLPDVRLQGGKLAALAVLFRASDGDLLETALLGDEQCRLGVCRVATTNIVAAKHSDVCASWLHLLFNDAAEEVRSGTAFAFHEISKQPDRSLQPWKDLIEAFVESDAFRDDPSDLIRGLDDNRQQLPTIAIRACERFLDLFAAVATDISNRRAGDVDHVAAVAFKLYSQKCRAGGDAKKELDLIDRICEVGWLTVRKELEALER